MSYSAFLEHVRALRTKTARFYRADLHVHMHDSHDYLEGNTSPVCNRFIK